MRRTTTENMRQVLGHEADNHELRQAVRAAYRHYFKYLAEFLMVPSISKQQLDQLVDHKGWNYLDDALSVGKGVVFVCFHIGNWDIAGSIIAIQGYPMNVVVDTFEPKRLNDVVQGYRIDKGVKIIPIEQAARKVLQVLRRNEILGLLMDIPTVEGGIPVQLFGATCHLPGGAATLALRTGAPILPGYVMRKPDNTFEGHIGAPIEYQPVGNMEIDVQHLTQAIVDRLAYFVQQDPEQWFLARHLWTNESTAPDTAWAVG